MFEKIQQQGNSKVDNLDLVNNLNTETNKPFVSNNDNPNILSSFEDNNNNHQSKSTPKKADQQQKKSSNSKVNIPNPPKDLDIEGNLYFWSEKSFYFG